MGLSIYDETEPIVYAKTLDISHTTVFQDLTPALAFPIRIDSILISNLAPGSVTAQLQLYLVSGYNLGEADIPAYSGFGAGPTIDMIALLAPPVMAAFIVPPGWKLQVKMLVTLGAAEYVIFVALGGIV